MTARWGICACLALGLALSAGCRTPQPVLKPPKEEEKLVPPPPMAKYSTTGYPDQAFDKPVDPGLQAMEAKQPGNGARGGSMSPGSMNGSGSNR